jgi:lycopene cyclase domain-containing protein
MTYFGFLLRFLVVPILILLAIAWWDHRRGRTLPPDLRAWPVWLPIAALALIALVYTTPWDNYLVATRVWWYEPDLVTGLVIGYVPIEEYTFFVLQPILTGLWVAFVARRLPTAPRPVRNPARLRVVATAIVSVIWLLSLVRLATGWGPGTYLGLLLAWALPPVMLQLAFGADILLRRWPLLLLGLLPSSLYLSATDALAIDGGTWTINPEQSLNWLIGGVLPIEEAIFFFMTNVLIVLGVTLILSRASVERLPDGLRRRLAPECPPAKALPAND